MKAKRVIRAIIVALEVLDGSQVVVKKQARKRLPFNPYRYIAAPIESK